MLLQEALFHILYVAQHQSSLFCCEWQAAHHGFPQYCRTRHIFINRVWCLTKGSFEVWTAFLSICHFPFGKCVVKVLTDSMATILSKKSYPTLTWQVLWLFVVLCFEMIQRYGTRPDAPGKCDRNENSLQLRGGQGRMQDKYQLSQWLISFSSNILPKK